MMTSGHNVAIRLNSKLRAWTDNDPLSRKVFVLGTGRSGTHLLARTVGAHPDVRAFIEDRRVFPLVTRIALDPTLESRLFPRIALTIRARHTRIAPLFLLDKSHTAIWIAERLADTFPRALFVGIERNPYAVVASMLKHEGILQWQHDWKSYPIPNRFLGISEANTTIYDRLTIAEQCALRWRTHADRLSELKDILGDRFTKVDYESLCLDPLSNLHEIQGFLGLGGAIPQPLLKLDSLNRWKRELDNSTIAKVARIVAD